MYLGQLRSSWSVRWLRRSLLGTLLLHCVGCYSLYQDPRYQGPPERPDALDTYYPHTAEFRGVNVETIRIEDAYTLERVTIQTSAGPTSILYYRRPTSSDSIVLVFPVLGGKKGLIENYFAEYFANHGLDSAIVERNEDFKKPENITRIEDVMRANLIRDRVALDLFEKNYHKKQFATFGISRGAINVALTAGVDKRLKHNVMLLGGTDIVSIFKRSEQPRIKTFKKDVMKQRGLSEEQFYDYLRERLVTDPKFLAQYIDSRKTLLMLALFDQTVPFRYGQKLREQLGNPRTIYLPAGHATSIAFTQMLPVFPPTDLLAFFPPDYIETEALDFYRQSFGIRATTWSLIPLRLLRLPLDAAAGIISSFRRVIRGTEPDEPAIISPPALTDAGR